MNLMSRLLWHSQPCYRDALVPLVLEVAREQGVTRERMTAMARRQQWLACGDALLVAVNLLCLTVIPETTLCLVLAASTAVWYPSLLRHCLLGVILRETLELKW